MRNCKLCESEIATPDRVMDIVFEYEREGDRTDWLAVKRDIEANIGVRDLTVVEVKRHVNNHITFALDV